MAINTWNVSLMRYGTDIVKWTKCKLDEIDRKSPQRIRNYNLDVMLTGCMYQGWKEEDD